MCDCNKAAMDRLAVLIDNLYDRSHVHDRVLAHFMVKTDTNDILKEVKQDIKERGGPGCMPHITKILAPAIKEIKESNRP